MRLNGRLKRLEQQAGSAAETGRILFAWEYPDDEAWQAAKAEHHRRWPEHEGIRFIEYGVKLPRFTDAVAKVRNDNGA